MITKADRRRFAALAIRTCLRGWTRAAGRSFVEELLLLVEAARDCFPSLTAGSSDHCCSLPTKLLADQVRSVHSAGLFLATQCAL